MTLRNQAEGGGFSHRKKVLMDSDGYRRGLRLFNQKEYYDAHEVWEDVWRASHGAEKKFLQGLIQVAVAFHHHSTGNVVGASSLLARACRNLTGCGDEFAGIRVAALLESLTLWRAALADHVHRPAHPVIELIE